jgi:nucleotide-binding universal stress UspA family protein
MFNKILLPVDLQETSLSDRAAEIAIDLADHCDSEIIVLTVIPDFGMPLVANYFPDDAMQKAQADVRKELARFVDKRFDKRGDIPVKIDVAQGSPHKVVLHYAALHHIDLIIVPSRAKEISKIFLGSSAAQIAERAHCSVMVVRPDT